MSNSSLATYTNISENKTSPRNAVIDTISIHCVVAQWTAKQTVDYLQPSNRNASCNYAVGKDGSIAIGVEEKDRSWCSSNPDNDHRAVTIEVASDTTDPYAVTDAAYEALIKLVADICQRNSIKELLWQADKTLIGQVDKQNMTVHRWFASKACPGDYLYNLHGDIASKVNALLCEPTEEVVDDDTLYRVQVGAYAEKANAETMLTKIKTDGFDAFVTTVDGLFKVQVGAYSIMSNAATMLAKVQAKGYDAFVTTVAGDAVSTDDTSYQVEITATVLNVRSGPGTSYAINTTVKKGETYTIVSEKGGWGELKSGAGWISLSYTK
ncbi:MAG: N-acetylmuramoyl-L-alanine amidase [Eubacteriales bacterium]